MTRAEVRQYRDRKAVAEHLEKGRSLTRKEAPLLGLTAARLESTIMALRDRGARINKFKGDFGAWVYVAHEKGLFENLEDDSQPTRTARLL